MKKFSELLIHKNLIQTKNRKIGIKYKNKMFIISKKIRSKMIISMCKLKFKNFQIKNDLNVCYK